MTRNYFYKCCEGQNVGKPQALPELDVPYHMSNSSLVCFGLKPSQICLWEALKKTFIY